MKLIKAVEARDFSSPRYWFTWVSLGVMRMVALLPLPVVVFLGSILGQLLYYAGAERRRVSRINLRIAFPDSSEGEIRKLNRACFRNVAIALFELGLAWWAPKRVAAMSEIEGLEHLQDAQRRGKGLIILTAHFTCLEIGGPKLHEYVPLQVMYKRPRNQLFDTFMASKRAAYTSSLASHHKPLALLRGLKRGEAMWYAPDQDFGTKDTVFVPFFGVDATALTATARIATISGAPVVPYYIVRKPYGRGYRLTVLPALRNFPSGDAEKDARTINRVLEHMIMQNPEQYLWMHKRYKNRPEGQSAVYPS